VISVFRRPTISDGVLRGAMMPSRITASSDHVFIATDAGNGDGGHAGMLICRI
jgi:hypothetical protein